MIDDMIDDMINGLLGLRDDEILIYCTDPSSNPCLPLPVDVSCHMADHIQGILAGFADQSKTSVLHMSSLYHAFLLCQVLFHPHLKSY